MGIKVLLDTDIGTDIDDAVCLAYLLAQPACDLLGITTVSGEAVKRAQMASVLCKVAGKSIPIFPGTEEPLLTDLFQPEAKQAVALEAWDHDVTFPEGQAVSFMRETIRSNPGEVTLLTIGGLTNIALLFAMDPEIPSLLKGMVTMGGKYANILPDIPLREWNAVQDPYATAIVYRHRMNVHRLVGLDVTCQVIMDAKAVAKRFQSPLLKPVLDFAKVWFHHVDRIVFHDPLAAVTIFDDAICQFTPGKVSVELTSKRLLGLTHWEPDAVEGQHEVALSVDPERFFDHFFSVFD